MKKKISVSTKKNLKIFQKSLVLGLGFFISSGIIFATSSSMDGEKSDYTAGDALSSITFNNLVKTLKDIFNDNGNIGIGVASPVEKLEVNGNIKSNGRQLYLGENLLYSDNSSVLISRSNHDTATQMIFQDLQGTNYGRVYGDGDGQNFGLLDGDTHWSYLAAKNHYTQFLINNSAKMTILNNGNVGIGITVPQKKLSVTNGDNAVVNIYSNGGSVGVLDAVDPTVSTTGRWLSINPTGGNVGIGTTSPTEKLDVNGTGRFAGNLTSNGEIISTSANAYRMVHGDYGTFFRNDGSDFWLMLTNAGDQYGEWNGLRPFAVNLLTGNIDMGSSLNVNNELFANKIYAGGSEVVTKDYVDTRVGICQENELMKGIAADGSIICENIEDTGDADVELLTKRVITKDDGRISWNAYVNSAASRYSNLVPVWRDTCYWDNTEEFPVVTATTRENCGDWICSDQFNTVNPLTQVSICGDVGSQSCPVNLYTITCIY